MTPLALATSPPFGYYRPSKNKKNGKIEQLNLQSHELIIDNKAFKLTDRVEVYTHRGFHTTAGSLKKGMRVTFDTKEDTSGSAHLTTIWIMSKKGYKR